MRCSNVTNSLDCEGQAIKYGLLLAKEFSFQKVIIETDNAMVAETLWFGDTQESQHSWNKFCIDELKNHLEWQINLIRREANGVADSAAKQAKETRVSWINFTACPLFLAPSSVSDMQ